MKLRWLWIGLCLILFSALLPNNLIVRAEPNTATTYYVTGTSDPTPGACTVRSDGGGYDCPSLRSAVIAANANPGWDTILLKHNTIYQLTIPMTSTDQPQTGDLDITQHLTFGYANICIFNCGATIQGGANYNDRVLEVYAGIRVDMKQITVRGGKNTVYDGGGIYNAGILTLTQSTVYNNQADKGGGILNIPGGVLTLVDSTVTSNTARLDYGGGVYNAGVLYLIDSVLEKNFTPEFGGGLYNQDGGWAIVDSGLISGNISGSPAVNGIGHGGGLYNDGQLIMTDTQVISNFAKNVAAAFSNGTTGVGTLTVVTFERNQAGTNGLGATGGGLEVRGRLTLDRVAILSNTAEIIGGVYIEGTNTVLTMTHSRIAGNVATGMSGGLYIPLQGKAIIQDSVFLSNTCADNGGGIYNHGTLELSGSLLSGNQSNNGGAINNQGSATLVNSTLSGNLASNEGGGIYDENSHSNLLLNNVTIVNNLANADANATGQGGGLRVVTGTITVYNTLIAQNSDWGVLNRPDCSGPLTSLTYSLIQNLSGCTLPISATGNITGQVAQIGPLKDNGGATWTHALLPNSPALNAGRPYTSALVLNNCRPTDQRGVARPIGSRCDIGAFELAQVYLPLAVR